MSLKLYCHKYQCGMRDLFFHLEQEDSSLGLAFHLQTSKDRDVAN